MWFVRKNAEDVEDLKEEVSVLQRRIDKLHGLVLRSQKEP